MEENKTKRFHKSKIYKLVCHTDFYYVGATTNTLPKRLSNHKQDSNKYPSRKVYAYFNEINWENVKIILLEELKLENIDQLRKEEDKYVRAHLSDPYCLNLKRVVNTEEENKSLIKKKDHDRYWNNYEKELNRGLEYYQKNNFKIVCSCGAEVVKTQHKRHLRTQKHLENECLQK